MSSQAVNGPPGTILAQAIRQDLGNEAKGTQIGNTDKTALEQVLAIYRPGQAGTSISSGNTPACPTDNQDVNLKLVKSVVLHGLYNDDPFIPTESHLSQSKDCLAIIRLVTQSTPQLLINLLGVGDAANEDDANLYQIHAWAWLLQKLLPLLSNAKFLGMRRETLETLEVILSELGALVIEGDHSRVALAYLKACADGVIERFKTDLKSTLRKSFWIELPPLSFYQLYQVRMLEVPSSGPKSQFNIRDAVEACSIAIQITLLVTKIGLAHEGPQNKQLYQSHSLMMLTNLMHICNGLKAWRAVTMRSRLSVQLYKQIVEALAEIISSNEIKLVRSLQQIVQKISILSIQSLLAHPITEIDQDTEVSLSALILLLLQYAEESAVIQTELSKDLIPCIKRAMQDTAKWQTRHRDLRVTLLKFSMTCSDDYAFHQMILSNLQLITGDEWQFQNPALQLLNARLAAGSPLTRNPGTDSETEEGPRKRRRIENPTEPLKNRPTAKEALISKVYSKLGGQFATDLDGLCQIAAEGFAKLSLSDQREVLCEIGALTCLCSKASDRKTPISKNFRQSHAACAVCDGFKDRLITNNSRASDDLVRIFATIQESDAFLHSSNARAYGMRTMRKIVKHGSDYFANRFGDHAFGQWCLQSLRSSNSDLRMLAVITLPSFPIFLDDNEKSKLERNNCLLKVREISSTADDTLQETCIIAWGRISRVIEGDDLHLALGILLGYLGHSNTYLAAVAYNEIESVAQAKSMTMSTLLAQFWRDLSVVVVSLLKTKPQVINSVSTLLGIQTQEFLTNTIAFTLPHMILNRKIDVVDSIVQAYNNTRGGNPESLFQICMTNITNILGFLLIQPVKDVEEFAISLLRQTDDTFRRLDLVELIKADPIAIMAETIRCYAALSPESKPQAQKAIRNIAAVCYKKPANTKREKNVDTLQNFFEGHVLGIITHYSDVLFSARVKHSMSEKRRNLRAIEDMIKLGKAGILSGLPQIAACLSSALDIKGLQEAALGGWSALINQLPSDDVSSYFAVTFCLLLKYWNDFDTRSKKLGTSFLFKMFERHGSVLGEEADTIPSLASIPDFEEYEIKLAAHRKHDLKDKLRIFAIRCSHENPLVVEQALVELRDFLGQHEQFVRNITNDEIPDSIISVAIRQLLDACVKHGHSQNPIARLSSECLGIIGAVDSNRIENSRKPDDLMILQNFETTEESVQFAHFLLEHHLVKAFLSATDTRAQGFLSFAMQELLKFCGFTSEVLGRQTTDLQLKGSQTRWTDFSVTARNVLSPYLSSKYVLSTVASSHKSTYPIFPQKRTYREWLTELLLDLLPKSRGVHTTTLFSEIISKIVKGQDLSILNFILPYIVLHVIISGAPEDKNNICLEMISILSHEISIDKHSEFEMVKRCSESVFLLIDHMSKWIREKRRFNAASHAQTARRQLSETADHTVDPSIACVENILSQLPPKLIGERSIQCQSYARALFYWEQYMRRCRSEKANMEPLYAQMQSIYAEIEEPDGIEGISTTLSVVDVDQQILEHRKAGRWLAVQDWYEHLLKESPADVDLQYGLLSSLKESGQYETLLVHLEPILKARNSLFYRTLNFGVESAWRSLNWEKLRLILENCPESAVSSFDITIGRAVNAFHNGNLATLGLILQDGRDHLVRSMTYSGTNSIRSCREVLFQCQAFAECEYINSTLQSASPNYIAMKQTLDGRLTLLGPSHREKQYLLALRRALLSSARGYEEFTIPSISSFWLTTAKLARKKKDYHLAFTAILNSNDTQNGPIEQAKLVWDEGRHRKAIKLLESATDANMFETTMSMTESFQDTDMSENQRRHPQSSAKARAMLLWARWMDSAGQIQSKVLVKKFQEVARLYSRWEKGHFYLGRHYNNILKTQKSMAPAKRPQSFLIGETIKLVCVNYMRAMVYGTKYIFQTLPHFLNLWLDFGVECESGIDEETGTDDFREHLIRQRKTQKDELFKAIKKLIFGQTPVYVFLTALPQMMSRVGIKSDTTWKILEALILRVLVTFPQHTMWSILAVWKSGQSERRNRAIRILNQLKIEKSSMVDLKTFIVAAQKLVHELLGLSNFEIKGKPTHVSLRDDLNFQHNVAPISLIIPVQSALNVSFPADGSTPNVAHNPFARDQASISKFEDDADVMSSLQKPRKITIIGSDGRRYPLMCKPKDDLRKDARLMEFNTIINRLLKKDDESSRRQLQIRTYAVTPLNEECGLIEWVNNLRPLRDIIIKSYRTKNIVVNYSDIRTVLDEASADPAKYHMFNDVLLPKFPSVFHEWFVETFPEPEAWFAARLSYVRTTAVMSMVGYVLGLGDRHGENILLDEVTGETQHVDFNCLFDKGLTFDKPERVPFRLTHNMVDAMGLTGYEGPFRRSSEVTLRILRQNEESLMTIMETFLHDPLVEWLQVKKRRQAMPSKAPDNPEDVLESIKNKLRGLHASDPMPLSVEGQVQELIQQAVNVDNLVRMYIGWCSYF